MTRTLTALYQTREDAQAAADRLKAAGLGDHVDIHDQTDTKDASGNGEGFMGKLRAMFGGHHDQHTYAEGMRRGHVLLTAKVDDLRASRAGELLDATTAVDLGRAESTWKSEGWTAPEGLPSAYADPAPAEDPWVDRARVRAYRTESAAEQAGEAYVTSNTYVEGDERQSSIGIGEVARPSSEAGFGTSRPV
jgi:hypothetical protein